MVGRATAEVKAEIQKKFPEAVVRIVQPGVPLSPIKVYVCQYGVVTFCCGGYILDMPFPNLIDGNGENVFILH